MFTSDLQAPSFVTKLEDITALEQSKVKISVKFTGKPMPEVKWFKNGKQVFASKRYYVETTGDTSFMVITDMRDEDQGEITATASNREGSVSQSAKLTMQSKFFPTLDHKIL